MESKFYKRDCIKRTLEIINQYEHHVMRNVPTEKEQFEVTLLINCLLGLLVLPKELWCEKLPNEPIRQLDGWGLKAEYIEDAGYEPERCLKCKTAKYTGS